MQGITDEQIVFNNETERQNKMKLEFQTGEIERSRVAIAKVKDDESGTTFTWVAVQRSHQHHDLIKVLTSFHDEMFLTPDEIIEFAYLDKGETK